MVLEMIQIDSGNLHLFIFAGVGGLTAMLLVLVFVFLAKGNSRTSCAENAEDEEFNIEKDVKIKDRIVIDMLNSTHEEKTCWVITDPDIKDNPIIYSSPGFCAFTGYNKKEIEGRNCRFLQGKDTNPEDIKRIREAIKKETETNVCLLNYRKDGTPFMNQFFLCPLYEKSGALAYFLGVQVEVMKKEKGGYIENPGWIYTQGNHC